MVNTQISLEGRDSRAVFDALLESVPNAQKVNLVHDALGPVKKKCEHELEFFISSWWDKC